MASGSQTRTQCRHGTYVPQGVLSARAPGLGWDSTSTVCQILPGLMVIWQKRLGKMVEDPNQSQPNAGVQADESGAWHPVPGDAIMQD